MKKYREGDGGTNLHRNNAAEWVMAAVLWPIAWVMGYFNRGNGRSRACDTVKETQ